MSAQEPLENKTILVLHLPKEATDFIMAQWQLGCSIVLDLNEYDVKISEVTRNKIALEAIEEEIAYSRLTSLKTQLLRAHKNLSRLEEKRALYTEPDTPVNLINAIEIQEERIVKLRQELGFGDD